MHRIRANEAYDLWHYRLAHACDDAMQNIGKVTTGTPPLKK